MSDINTDSLSKLTIKQLCIMADQYFQIQLPERGMLKKDMINLITSANLRVDKVADMVPDDQTQLALRKSGKKGIAPREGYVRMIIQRSAYNGPQRPVFLGHNGTGYLVLRGKEFDFPCKAMSALTDAIEFTSVWDDDLKTAIGYGGWALKEQDSYPYGIIGWGAGTEKWQIRHDYL